MNTLTRLRLKLAARLHIFANQLAEEAGISESTINEGVESSAFACAVAHPPGADEFLAHLVGSQDPSTSLAVMEVLWDAPPSDAGVEALYRKAFAMPSAETPVSGVPLKFRGIPVPAVPAVPSFGQGTPESTIAFDVLSHLNPPQLPRLLHAFFQTARAVLDQDPSSNPQSFFLPERAISCTTHIRRRLSRIAKC